MPRPSREPLGLLLARTAKAVSRAFDDALAEAGGSRPMWLVLLALKRGTWATQAQLAAALDISGPTLTHHLDGLEAQGLVTRRRDPDNRRVHIVELTADGQAMFQRLRRAASRHDARLRRDLDDEQVEALRELLLQLHANVAPTSATEADR